MDNGISPICCGKHHKMERFMEICLMLLLYEDIGHGYILLEKLQQFGFSDDEINVSTLYRTLRKMEKDDSVLSEWEEGNQGPKRRIYHLTEQGKGNLAEWIRILKQRRTRINKLISQYEEITGSN
jgi:PadR family transcriptional regulator, regulatory protein PadR